MSYWWCQREFWRVWKMDFWRLTHPWTTAPGRLLRTVSRDVAWKLRSNVSWASSWLCGSLHHRDTWICGLSCFQKFQTCFLGRFGDLRNYMNSREINVDQGPVNPKPWNVHVLVVVLCLEMRVQWDTWTRFLILLFLDSLLLHRQ